MTLEPLRVCCMPECEKKLPRNQPLPLCRDCGIKVALAHLNDAAMLDAVRVEQYRIREAARHSRHMGTTRTSVVYYARLDADRIKIGFTSNILTRMRDLRVLPENLLAVEPGGRNLEGRRHQQFRADQIRGEEFRPSDALLAHTLALREIHGLPEFPIDTKTVTVRRVE